MYFTLQTMKKPLIVILAGGIGKRFRPFTINKVLFPFLGKTFLQHLLEMIQQAGFSDVLITTNNETQQWLDSYHSEGLSIRTKIQPEALGMGDALLQLEQEINNQPILVMNASDLVDPAFFKVLLEKSQDAYAYVVGKKMSTYFPGGYLKIDGNRVTEIVEKPEKGSEPSDMVNLVFHYFSIPADYFQQLHQTPDNTDAQYEEALAKLMKEKEVAYVPYDGFWTKLNYCHTVLDMTETFLNKLVTAYTAPSAKIGRNVSMEGIVYIDEGAIIDDFAVIKGPAYIGKNVRIGNHSLVRQSIIEDGTIVGFGSEVARSYVGPRCMLHHNFIGDSILESDINPSWGTTTANLRLDNELIKIRLPDKVIETERTKLGSIIAKGVFSGVNCSFMPGITIGANAKIYPGTVVKHAVKENEVLKG